ncbi:MAG: cysteine desulfurase family protein [Nitrospirota bacterium]
MIYLDNNASTPVDPEVAEAVIFALRNNFGNPSSSHKAGRTAREAVETAREMVASLINASPHEIFFTSGGTESNNLAITGIASKNKRGHIITSIIEHPSVMNTCRHLEENGFEITYVPAGRDGRVSAEDVERAIRHDTILVTIMHANNETGVLQPLKEIGGITRQRNIPFHTDAAQSAGKIPVKADELNIDMLTIAAHKFYGPKGIGALYIRKGLTIKPVMSGAAHESGLRPGTENVPAIAGLGKACELSSRYTSLWASQTLSLTTMLYNGLRQRAGSITLNGHETLRLPNTVNISVRGVDAADLLERLGERVAASSGSACHAGSRKPSSILLSMGISEQDALSSIRLSTGKDNTEKEIMEAIDIISASIEALRRRSP